MNKFINNEINNEENNDRKLNLIFNYDKDLPQVGSLKRKYLQDKVIELSKIEQPPQKSTEWYRMRDTMLTASDWGAVLGENHYDDGTEVLLVKCGKEKVFPKSSIDAMDWGNKYEDVAVLIYKYRNKVEVLDFGCIRHPFIPFLGASPDGITPDGVMLEIKCPTRRKITGIPPSYYLCQVQGQLEVCDLDRCDFLECLIKEYQNETDYINDNFEGDTKYNKFGNEKGILAELYKKSDPNKKRFYEYSPVNIIGDEINEWKNMIISKYESKKETDIENNISYDGDIELSCFSYWYLEEVSCIPIYRNHTWFQESKPILEDFWNLVLKYRELGIDRLTQDISIKKAIKKVDRDEKRELKKKELERKKIDKKQKNIREFISLDDTFSFVSSTTEDKTTFSSSNSDIEDDDDFSVKTYGKSLFDVSDLTNVTNLSNTMFNENNSNELKEIKIKKEKPTIKSSLFN